MPFNVFIFFPFVFFLLDVLAKYWVQSGIVKLKGLKDNFIMPVVTAFNFFHPDFDFFCCKAHVFFKILQFHLPQIYIQVADSGASYGLEDGWNVMDQQRTIRVGSVNITFGKVLMIWW